jgi:hypothetical protein
MLNIFPSFQFCHDFFSGLHFCSHVVLIIYVVQIFVPSVVMIDYVAQNFVLIVIVIFLWTVNFVL